MPQFFWSVFRKVLPFISPQTSSCVFLNCLLDYRINYVSTRIVGFSHFWKCVWYMYICTSVFKHVFISLCVHVETRGQRQIYSFVMLHHIFETAFLVPQVCIFDQTAWQSKPWDRPVSTPESHMCALTSSSHLGAGELNAGTQAWGI